MSAITPKAPMSRLSHQTVRTSWPAYLGAFVALATGVVLIATTINLIGSVDATLSTGVTQEQRQELDGLTSMFGMMSAVSLFMAIFVVGSTSGSWSRLDAKSSDYSGSSVPPDAKSAASCWVSPPSSPWPLSWSGV
jgi:hypothetical protein